jgi:hypothetical protein
LIFLNQKGGSIRLGKCRSVKRWMFVVLFLVLINFVSSEVVVFKNYETTTILEKNSLNIQRKISLENVGANPIIPGELHFKLHEIIKKDKVASKVNNLGAVNDFEKELKTRSVETKEETDLVVSVWEPVLPKFSYNVHLNYDLDFKPKGILFFEIRVPLEETTIPIKNQKQSLYIPSKYHITYAPDAEITSVKKGEKKYKVVSWENREDMVVEYTILPLPKMGIRAVNVFWVLIIIILLITTFFIHRRLRNG